MVAVFAGSGVEPSLEGAVHRFGCSEATGSGDLFDGPVSGLEESACGVEPDGFDVVGCGGTYFGFEDSGELAFGEVDVLG